MFFCHFPAKARLTLTRATHVVSVRSGACRRWYHQQYFQELLSQFPPVDHAVAYGSGVFKQGSCPLPEDKMIDLIFVVDDTSQWHRENIRQNSWHYSSLFQKPTFVRLKLLELLQKTKPYVLYNTKIPFNGQVIKYGVISKEHLVEDLRHWTTLFVSGRMQKPTLVIKSDEEVAYAQHDNLRKALAYALLSRLQNHVSERMLYTTICEISYAGDKRMRIAEDKNKIKNIVEGSFHDFRRLYDPVIDEFVRYGIIYRFQQKPHDTADRPFIAMKHSHSKTALYEYFPQDMALTFSMNPIEDNAKYLQRIVASSSFHSIWKGALTAGVWKGASYAYDKLRKGLKDA